MNIDKNFVYDLEKHYWILYGYEVPLTLIMIIHLHLNNLINDKKLSAMLNGLNKGTLLTFRRTYHCKINDSWHSEEPMIKILFDVYDKLVTTGRLKLTDIPMETLIKYVQRMLNTPKNYCINWIVRKFITPVIERSKDPSYHGRLYQEYLNSFDKNLSVQCKITSYEDFHTFGYCCPDCDGPYNYYKQHQYEHYVLSTWIKNIAQYFKESFDKLRDVGYLKNKTAYDPFSGFLPRKLNNVI